jgi:hypothetical protein
MLGIALSVGRLARVPFSAAFFFAVAIVILTLYASAFAGALWWTALLVHIGGVLLLGFEALRLVKQRVPIPAPVPLGVLSLLCAWFWAVHGTDEYFLYDEYAHWGIFLKEMLALDGFWTADSNSFHPRYPPAAPLWQYFFNAFSSPSEGKAYFAHFVLLLAPLLSLWNGVRWSQPLWIGAILALVIAAIANFGLGVTLYVDHIVAVWFLGVVIAAIADDDLASRRVLLYAAPLAVIALLKDVGLAFAACGAAILVALVVLRLLAHERRGSALRTASAAAAVLLAPALLCVQVWVWNRDALGVAPDIVSVDGMVDGLVDEAASTVSERDTEIERRLAEVLFDQQISNSEVSWNFNEFTYDTRALFTDSFRLTTFGLLVGFVLWWAVITYAVLNAESRRKWLIVAGGALVTAIFYIAMVHYSLRFVFGERGLELPSYVRYVNVVALPLFVLSFCPLLPAFRDDEPERAWLLHGWRVPRRAALCVAALVAVYAIETPYLRPLLQPNPKVPLRADFEPLLEQIRASVGSSRVWIYFPRDLPNQFVSRLILFTLAPTPAVVERSAAFLASDESVIATAWRPFDYVWIPSELTPDETAGLSPFIAGVARPGLYHVQSSSSDTVTLVALGEQTPAY